MREEKNVFHVIFPDAPAGKKKTQITLFSLKGGKKKSRYFPFPGKGRKKHVSCYFPREEKNIPLTG